jgi:FKBP-type peptidyl-prolyl cis-trans isomerase
MKKMSLLFVLACAATVLFAQNKPAKIELKTQLDSVNYAYGIVMATNVKRQMDKDLVYAIYQAAFDAVLNGDPTLIPADKANKMFSDYNRQTATRALAAYKAEQKAFLDKNKTRKEVTTTASGLQYEVMKKGSGTEAPKATDRVEVHYHGTLIDGTIFDSSVQRGQTSSFGLNQVIKGWTEGLQYMKVGDKFKFFIPSELAYGDNPRPGGPIKPGAALIFEVELFKINP